MAVEQSDKFREKKPPNEDVIFRMNYQLLSEKGETIKRSRYALRLTDRYLWLSPKLSLPFPSVTNLTLTRNDTVLKISYSSDYGEIHSFYIQGIVLIGFPSKYLTQFLYRCLRELCFDSEKILGKDAHGHCEICGAKASRSVGTGSLCNIGIASLFGIYSWSPIVRNLCRVHAGRHNVSDNMKTAFMGYLGFPGILLAPFRVIGSMWSLLKAFPNLGGHAFISFFFGVLIPMGGIGFIVWWIFFH